MPVQVEHFELGDSEVEELEFLPQQLGRVFQAAKTITMNSLRSNFNLPGKELVSQVMVQQGELEEVKLEQRGQEVLDLEEQAGAQGSIVKAQVGEGASL